MRENYQQSLTYTLRHEGGYVNHPKDPGGPTNHGITLRTYRQYYGVEKTVEDLRQIAMGEIAAIYLQGYWATCSADQLPSGVDYAIFDAAVNSGPQRATRWLQEVVGVSIDGIIGPRTLSAASELSPVYIVTQVCDTRLAYLQSLKMWGIFGRGWGKRIDDVRHRAYAMAQRIASEQQTSLIPATPDPINDKENI